MEGAIVIAKPLMGFVRLNRRTSMAMTPSHFTKTGAYEKFRLKCVEAMAGPNVKTVVDIGAGKRWHFTSEIKHALIETLIGVDIDASEMIENDLLDQKIEADVSNSIPIPPNSVDLVMVRAGVEHFSDNRGFVRNCQKCLKPGGYLIATFANKYAPFAILNQLLPQRLSAVVLKSLVPGSSGILGFKTHYDRASYTAFTTLLSDNDFELEYYYPSFFSSNYFGFFVPLYAVSIVCDLLRFALGIKNLASYHLFVARKR